MRRATILLEIVEEGDTFDLFVSVTGELNTSEAIGFMEMAKLQHLDAKRTNPIVMHQTSDNGPFGDMYVTPSADTNTEGQG